MLIKLVIVGKTSEAYLKEGMKMYEKRLSHYLPLETIIIDDTKKNNKSTSTSFIKQKEGELIFKFLKPNDYVILLDEKGKKYSSIEFAKLLQKFMGTLQVNLVFIIGGAFGFDEKIYNRSNLLLSLSDMTFSHQMVRLFFVEQLFRAMTIIKNEPYHHH